MTNRLMLGIVCLGLAIGSVSPIPAPAADPPSTELFARKNLVAWCIVPFDSKKRGPEERAAMLEKLGFSKFAYDYRAEHVPTFDQEMESLKKHKVELTAWWFPTSLNDEAKMTLAVFAKHKVTPQLWVTGGGGPTKDQADQKARVIAEANRIRPIAEAAAKVGCKVALYNHGGWFGEPENQIEVIEEIKRQLATAKPSDSSNKPPVAVGIVYNQHHGHDHIDRFAALLQKMKPYLLCLNLNGMTKEGDRKGQKIMQLGEGDLDLKLLKVVKESGYTGPIGILGHTQDDAEERLHDNLDGLDWLLPQLDGKPAGAKPKMRTPVPKAVAAVAPPPAKPIGPALVEGKFGKALDGRSGGALVKGRDEFRQFPLTVECWTKLADKGPFNILVAHEQKSSGTHWELFSAAGSGTFTVYLPGFAPDHCRSDAMLCDDKWRHVAMVLEPERVRLYVDGKPVADQKHKRSAQPTVPGELGLATLIDRGIGCTGLVDEVRISKGIRDITASPDKPFMPDDTTVALWHLDELAETKRLDDAGPHKNAALVGQAGKTPHPNPLPTTEAAVPEPGRGDKASSKIEGHWGTDAVGFNWTEADSRDDRFGKMDVGPFLSTSLGVPLAPAAWHDPVYKAIVVRVGSKRQASISYDTELLRATAGWTGFVRFDPARFGIIGAPRPDGPITFVTPSLPGWSLQDEFSNFRADHRYGPLPKEVAHYEGLYRHGQRVVLKSRVSSVERRVPEKAEERGLRDEGQERRQPQAGVIPSPPSSGERVRVRGPSGEKPVHEEKPSSSGTRPSTLDSQPSNAPLSLTLSPEDGGEGTGKLDSTSTLIFETPWLEVTADAAALTRTLLVGPSDVALKMLVADPKARVAVHPKSEAASVAPGHGGCHVLTIAPHDKPVTIKLLIASPDTNEAAFHKLLAASSAPEDVLALTEPGPTIWGEPLVTRGEVSRVTSVESRVPEEGKRVPSSLALDSRHSSLDYVIDTITLPFDNPFNALLFCGGHDFLPDGRAAVCTLHGDVWLVDGIDENLERITWRRFATGLFQPLGVKCRVTSVESRVPEDGERPRSRLALVPQLSTLSSSLALVTGHSSLDTSDLFIVGRDQITRLHDFNNDGEADYYENFNNDAHTTMNGHEYVACLEADRAGNLYYVKGNNNSQTPHDGSLLRVSADGSKLEVFATGFRNPNGMSIGPNDEITVAPQEGEWTPASAVFDVREGGFYGMMPSHHQATAPTDFIRPICWFSRRDDNSCGGQVWATSDKFGPLSGHLLHMSYGQCKLRLVLREEVEGRGLMVEGKTEGQHDQPPVRRGSPDPAETPDRRSPLPLANPESKPEEETFGRGPVRDQETRAQQHFSDPQPSTLNHRPFNGGSVELPLTFASGIHRGRMNPRDGQLYLTGLKGWVSSAVNDGCFQRVRYTGKYEVRSMRYESDKKAAPSDSSFIIHTSSFQTFRNGISLTFTGDLDREAAEDQSSYQLEAWNYKWSEAYGSPEFKPSAPGQVGRDEIEPKSATLLEDGRTVFIELPNLKPVDQLAVSYTLLTKGTKDQSSPASSGAAATPPHRATPSGQVEIEQTLTLTLNSIPDRTMPEEKLHRPKPSIQPEGKLVAGISVRSDVLLDEAGHRMFAWSIPETSRPQSSGSAGPLTVRATAWLRVPTTGEYRFSREGTGLATVAFHGNPDAKQPLSATAAISVRLKRGWNEIAVQYELPREGNAHFRLLWESARFPREAVPASSLFRRHPPHDVGAAFWDAFSNGQVAYQKHNCARCHASSIADQYAGFRKSTPHALRGAPRLDDSGRRFTATWLANWLVDPSRLKHDSTMPGLLPKNEPQSAVDLAAYLGSLVETAEPAGPVSVKTTDDEAAARRGSDLFEKLGCIACHSFAEPQQEDEWNRESLHFTKAKFRDEALERFLLAPQRHHATSFMPDFRLTADEATSLSAYIRQQSRGELAELAGTQLGNVERGHRAFEKLKCGQCHTMKSDDKLPVAHLASVFRDGPSRGCLAEQATADPKAPRFVFSEETRDALRGFVTLMTEADAKQIEERPTDLANYALAETMASLRCNVCHARDEARSLWPEIVAEEGSGRAVEAVPQLTWVGEKLQGPWIEKLLKGELDVSRDRKMGTPARPFGLSVNGSSEQAKEKHEDWTGKSAHPPVRATKPRPWLTARMPSFPAYANLIAHGMAAEHGVPFEEPLPTKLDPKQIEIGKQLTLQNGGLDCRQCHGIGKEQPRGDASTQIALGINFALTRDRMRPEFALRQMLDPPRYDIGSRMPRFAPDLRTTAAKHIAGGDARKQFEALKQFLWSVKVDE